MGQYEEDAKYQLAETCCASVSIADLMGMSEDKSTTANDIFDINRKQTYGDIAGLTALRETISKIYGAETTEIIGVQDILVTPGAIAANTIAALSLLKEGDHMICQIPTYQQLYSVPHSMGVDVSFWESKETNEWLPDLNELNAMITTKTKLIVLK